MAPRKNARDPLSPIRDHHPYRVRYVLPGSVLRAGWMTFDNPGGSARHPGVEALLAIPGVQSVTLHRNDVIVIRDPEVCWDAILGEVREVIQSVFLHRPPLDAAAAEDAGGNAG